MQLETQTVDLREAFEELFPIPKCLHIAGDSFLLVHKDFDVHGKPNGPMSNLVVGLSLHLLLLALPQGAGHKAV